MEGRVMGCSSTERGYRSERLPCCVVLVIQWRGDEVECGKVEAETIVVVSSVPGSDVHQEDGLGAGSPLALY